MTVPSQPPPLPSAAAGASTAGPAAAPVEADLIAAAVLACPAVVALHAGGLLQVATYLPGRRVAGVRTDEARVQVSLVAAAGVPLPAVVAQVRSAVSSLVGGRPVDVHVADVAEPGEVAGPSVPVTASGAM